MSPHGKALRCVRARGQGFRVCRRYRLRLLSRQLRVTGLIDVGKPAMPCLTLERTREFILGIGSASVEPKEGTWDSGGKVVFSVKEISVVKASTDSELRVGSSILATRSERIELFFLE
jgi:hypothetical protein